MNPNTDQTQAELEDELIACVHSYWKKLEPTRIITIIRAVAEEFEHFFILERLQRGDEISDKALQQKAVQRLLRRSLS